MRFIVYRDIEEVSGHECYSTEADTKEEALENFLAGKCRFEFQEIEVTQLEIPTILDVKKENR